jgi:hypothetical protein
MRRYSIIAATLLMGGVIVPGARFARAADNPDAPPAKVFDQKLRGKAALASVQAKGQVASVAAGAGWSEAELTRTLSTDESAGVDETGAVFFVEPTYDAAVAATHGGPIASTPSAAAPEAGRVSNPGAAPILIAPPASTAPSDPAVATDGSAPNGSAIPKAAAPSPEVGEGPFPYSQTFLLNSRPGATKTIFLKFTGYNVTAAGSAWGINYNGPAYDTDGNPATFSAAEQDTIQSVWQRVAEDYAPFDVNVTTQDPGIAAIDRTNAADLNYGTTVAFVNGPATPCGGGCGGVAYLNVFSAYTGVPFGGSHQFYQPAWVFPAGVPGAKNMAEAASHEAGHNFSLNHDGCTGAAPPSCTGAVGYYTGHANWAPIMGVGYYEPVVQWSAGEYAGANNPENDTLKIAGHIPFIADTANVSIATATDMGVVTNPSNPLQTGSGLINGASPSGDNDYFKFYSPTAKTVTITANPAPTSPNLDLGLTLFDAGGNQLAYNNPTSGQVNGDVASGMGASITIDLPSYGYYYLRVWDEQTDASGDAGYTFYGSQGTYTVSVATGIPPGDGFWKVPVARLLDTRPTPIPTGTSINLTVAGVFGVPANATAVALNVAAVSSTASGHLRVYPAGAPLPTASVLNFNAGKNTPNNVIVKVGAAGQISIYDGGVTSVIVDVSGYWVPVDDQNDQYQSVATPTRIYNAALAGGATVTVPVLGLGGVPTQAGLPGNGIIAVVVNVGANNPTATGHIRVWPSTSAMPNASSNNFVVGDSRMNQVITEIGTDGAIKVFNATSGTLNLSVDTVGWFQWGGLAFKPLDPIRPLDTRSPSNIVAPGDFREVQIRGFGGVPNSTDVKAVVLNVASVSSTAAGSIDTGPSGANPALPGLLHPAGENVANLTTVPIGADGKIRVRNNSAGNSHIIVDITGYFTN